MYISIIYYYYLKGLFKIQFIDYLFQLFNETPPLDYEYPPLPPWKVK